MESLEEHAGFKCWENVGKAFYIRLTLSLALQGSFTTLTYNYASSLLGKNRSAKCFDTILVGGKTYKVFPLFSR